MPTQELRRRQDSILGQEHIDEARNIIRGKLAEMELLEVNPKKKEVLGTEDAKMRKITSPDSPGGKFVTPEEAAKLTKAQAEKGTGLDRNASQLTYGDGKASTELEQAKNDSISVKESFSEGDISSSKSSFKDMVREDGSSGLGSLDAQRSQDGFIGFTSETAENITTTSNVSSKNRIDTGLDEIASFLYHRDPDNALAAMEGIEGEKQAVETKIKGVRENFTRLGISDAHFREVIDMLVDMGDTKTMQGLNPSEILQASLSGSENFKREKGESMPPDEILKKTYEAAQKMESGEIKNIDSEDPAYFTLKQIMTTQKGKGRTDLSDWIESFLFEDEKVRKAA
jgi:hypothetical protein